MPDDAVEQARSPVVDYPRGTFAADPNEDDDG